MNINNKILVIDDDPYSLEIFGVLSNILSNVEIFTATSFFQVEEIVNKNIIDIIFIDIVIPDFDGYEISKLLKTSKNTENAYYIFISGEKRKIQDRVKAFLSGGHEFMLKPIDLKELELFIVNKINFLRKIKINSAKSQKTPFNLDTKKQSLQIENRNVTLTSLEFKLFELFVKNPENAFSSDDIASIIWGSKYKTTPDNVRGLIARLRNKIEKEPKKPNYIINSKTRGYIFYPNGKD